MGVRCKHNQPFQTLCQISRFQQTYVEMFILVRLKSHLMRLESKFLDLAVSSFQFQNSEYVCAHRVMVYEVKLFQMNLQKTNSSQVKVHANLQLLLKLFCLCATFTSSILMFRNCKLHLFIRGVVFNQQKDDQMLLVLFLTK